MDIQKRPANGADIPFLLALRRETMDLHLIASGDGISDECHLDRLMHHFDCAEVLTNNGETVGLLKVKRQPQLWEIIQIQLCCQLQGKGIGRWLLENVLADAALAGAEVRLGVLKDNPARNLYGRLGFKIIGEDDHEYFMHHVR